MATLYEIDQDLQALIAAISQEALDENTIAEAIDAYLADAATEKIDAYCRLIAEQESLAAARRSEAARLKELAAQADNLAARLRNRLAAFFTRAGKQRFETERFKISLRQGAPYVDILLPPEELPEQYRRVKIEADKIAIAQALKAGEHLPWAMLRQGPPTVSIR